MVQLASTPLSTTFSSNRFKHLQHFLDDHHLDMGNLEFLAGDASFRKYYRIRIGRQSWVLMDAPPPENPQAFIQMAQILKENGFSAPHIYGADLKAGFILLEDFGDLTFTQALKQGHNEQDLYELAIDTLIQVHTRILDKPSFLPQYTVEKLYDEAKLFIQWYYPAIYNKELPSTAAEEYESLWRPLFETTLISPASTVLRDYHVDNLMILNRPGTDACGLLDFQDACWGPIVYDVISLLEDARRDIPSPLVEALWHRYVKAFPDYSTEELHRTAVILSAGRHAKIMGIFTRLSRRDGKDGYLQHIPRLWRHLERCLEHPHLAPLKQWFNTYIPQRQVPCPSVKP